MSVAVLKDCLTLLASRRLALAVEVHVRALRLLDDNLFPFGFEGFLNQFTEQLKPAVLQVRTFDLELRRGRGEFLERDAVVAFFTFSLLYSLTFFVSSC